MSFELGGGVRAVSCSFPLQREKHVVCQRGAARKIVRLQKSLRRVEAV
jgi:hypothetical protein